ncbi:MAG: glycosyltransferase [Deltaproteobacteria bacterium]|nr:glycosyltransferase [Deltaproteobacteria bacterium]
MRIHQLLVSLEYADAVASHALATQRALRALGHESEIFVERHDPRMEAQCRSFEEIDESEGAATIYHHSFWSGPTRDRLLALRGRRAMIYHNVTPDHFFAGYAADLRDSARRAREALDELRTVIDVPIAVSQFNRAELLERGFADVEVLPMPVDLETLAKTPPDPDLMAALADGCVSFLFVGRVAPNKRQEDVIRVFAWYNRFLERASRLILVGDAPELRDYAADLRELAREAGVADCVRFAGKVPLPELVAYYRSAHLFLCMSEHEGFGAPLVEAMSFDVPVLARDAAGVAETLGGAGVLLRERDVPRIAEKAHRVLADPTVRESILRGQRERLAAFDPALFAPRLARIAERLTRQA